MIVYVLTSYDDGETSVVGAFSTRATAVLRTCASPPLDWGPEDESRPDGALVGMPTGGMGDWYFLVTRCEVDK